jgi:hypothetical protein
MYLYIVFVCPLCASVMRGRTVYRETGRKETRGEWLVSSSIADTGKFWKILGYYYLPVSVPVLQILEDSDKILVIPVSRPAASYYPNILILYFAVSEKTKFDKNSLGRLSKNQAKHLIWIVIYCLAKIYVEYFEKLIQGSVLKYLDNMKQPAQDYFYRTWFFQTLQNKIKTAICLCIKRTINLIYQYNWTTSMA